MKLRWTMNRKSVRDGVRGWSLIRFNVQPRGRFTWRPSPISGTSVIWFLLTLFLSSRESLVGMSRRRAIRWRLQILVILWYVIASAFFGRAGRWKLINAIAVCSYYLLRAYAFWFFLLACYLYMCAMSLCITEANVEEGWRERACAVAACGCCPWYLPT